MTVLEELILLHAGIGFMVWWCVGTVRGRTADRTYDARMSSPMRFFLMPGRLVERTVWNRQQRIIGWIGLVLAAVIYANTMFNILTRD